MLNSIVSTSFLTVQIIIKSFKDFLWIGKQPHIFTIFKKGRKDLAENYQPIRRTSDIVNVPKTIANSSVIRCLEANNLLHSSQHGFCSGRPVDTNLLESYDHITKLLDAGEPTDMILFGFSKTFDKICHKWLSIKLHAVKLEEKFLFWILDFLYMQSQCFQLFDDSGSCILSLSKHVLSRVAQGSVLCPMLFNIFINDAPSTISSKLTLYADNLKLIRSPLSCQDNTLQQNNYGLLDQWAEAWLCKFNVVKYHVIHLGNWILVDLFVSQVTHFPL